MWLFLRVDGVRLFEHQSPRWSPYLSALRWMLECLPFALAIASFLAISAIGLYFAVRRTSYIAAASWTAGLGLILPCGLGLAGRWLADAFLKRNVGSEDGDMLGLLLSGLVVVAWQAVTAALLAYRLSLGLRQTREILAGSPS